MRIRKLELQGFKSFADRAAFHFGPGISGVVGPNGCGKSNIVDAVKWCIGEQSAKSLRGESMSDVIFAGSSTRQGVSFAEVSLTFVAGEEPFPGIWARFPELDVTRRLYRDGHSEYLINQERVRLRDFADLFMDTGVGNQLYSFIEQGRIGLIVHARPEQRRTLIEEAAGISRYKLRRQETMEKLESTRTSLERVADLAEELGRQLRAAERAVQKAARWRMLHTRVRQEETFISLARLSGLIGDRRALSERVRVARAEFEEATRAVERHEEDLVRRRTAMEAIEEEVGRLRDRLAELEAQRRVEESALQYQARERETGTARLTRLAVDQEELRVERDVAEAEAERRRSAREEAERALEGARATAERAGRESAEAARRVEEARAVLGRARQEAMAAFEQAARARAVRSGMEGRRADLEGRRTRLDARLAEARQAGSHVEEEIQRLDVQLQAAEREVADARRAVEEGRGGEAAALAKRDAATRAVREREQALRTAEQAVFQREQALTLASRAREQVRVRVESLDDLLRRNPAAPDGVKAALAVAGVLGVLASQLDVPEALEGLLARALDGGLETVLVPDIAVATAVARAVGKQRARVAVVGPSRPLPDWARGVTGTDVGLRALAGLLAGCEEAATVEEALARGGRVVTRDGALHREDGVLLLGQEVGAGTAALKQRRELAAAREELTGKEAAVAEASQLVAAAKDALAPARGAIEAAMVAVRGTEEEIKGAAEVTERLRATVRSRELALGEVRHRLNARQAEKQQTIRAAAGLASEDTAIRQAAEALEAEDLRAADAIRQAEERQGAAEERVREAQRELEAQEPRLAATTAESQRARSDSAALARESQVQGEAFAAARQRADRAQSRSVQVEAERGTLEARVAQLAEEIQTTSASVQRLGEEVGSVRAALDGRKDEAKETRERVRVAEAATKAARDRRDGARDRLADADRLLGEVRATAERVRLEAEEKLGLSLPALLDRMERDRQVLVEGWEPLPVPGVALPEAVPTLRIVPADLESDVAARVVGLAAFREQLGRLGEVNPTAEDEYREIAERHGDIERQRADLAEAMAIIEEAIARINRTCRERFRETFDLVNDHFSKMYPRLVGGGSGRLQLTDEEDLLTCGVEIVVQPPGKKVQNLSLLSGGEKAMAALGLIFSLFLVKPSPFCLLDEVDAPLDEGNGARFNEVLKEMSSRAQFIVVTHNKKTMEAADVLYGVTMPEPGASRLVTVKIE